MDNDTPVIDGPAGVAEPVTFASLGCINAKTLTALEKNGMATAFPIQAAVVPAAVAGRDLLVQSPTGSGKTIAFGLPIVEQLKVGTNQPAAVVLVPTRELAVQVCADLAPIAGPKHLHVTAVYGGAPIHIQARAVKTAAIIVATPGRLDDLIRQRKCDLRGVRIVVLDEADRMLDMGFQPQVDAIVDAIPKRQQTLLFSATLEGRVAKAAASYTSDAKTITNDVAPGAGGLIQHVALNTTTSSKVDTVLDAIADEDRDLAVIFVRTKAGADRLDGRLREQGLRSTAIHGGMTQGARLREYRRFQNGQCDVLVATDVFARGMDLDRITHVVNYDLPEDADTYQHRSGRTGRAGRTGTAITLVMPKERAKVRRMLIEAGHDGGAIIDDIRTCQFRKPAPRPMPENTKPERPRREATAPAGRPPQPGDRDVAGTVQQYNDDKGFGFIRPDGGGDDLFFHRKSVLARDGKPMRSGMRVQCSVAESDKGLRAERVQQVSGGRPAPSRDDRRPAPDRHERPAAAAAPRERTPSSRPSKPWEQNRPSGSQKPWERKQSTGSAPKKTWGRDVQPGTDRDAKPAGGKPWEQRDKAASKPTGYKKPWERDNTKKNGKPFAPKGTGSKPFAKSGPSGGKPFGAKATGGKPFGAKPATSGKPFAPAGSSSRAFKAFGAKSQPKGARPSSR